MFSTEDKQLTFQLTFGTMCCSNFLAFFEGIISMFMLLDASSIFKKAVILLISVVDA